MNEKLQFWKLLGFTLSWNLSHSIKSRRVSTLAVIAIFWKFSSNTCYAMDINVS